MALRILIYELQILSTNVVVAALVLEKYVVWLVKRKIPLIVVVSQY